MISFTHNGPQFKAALMRGVARSPEARRAALLDLTRSIGKEVMRISPIDTGRFKKGEAQAFNGALGVAAFSAALVMNTRSRQYDKIVKQLRRQLSFWRRVVSWLQRNDKVYTKGLGKQKKGRGRPTKAYKTATKMVARSEKYLADYLASGGTGAVIGLERFQRRYEAYRRKDQDADMVLTRAYNTDKDGREHGGWGRLIEAGGQSIVRLVNREPHAKIVEYKFRVRARAIQAAGYGMIKKTSNAYVKKIAGATGLKQVGS